MLGRVARRSVMRERSHLRGTGAEGDSDGEAVMIVTADSQVPADAGNAAGR
jgi:hypothetical protein